ncbi:phosphatidylinositol transfer protein SFH5 [Lineolata rhizophorae]|uniref:Phosphatidylinositol transfer protein SFH5 n=1 Tax=Lineolata rhizophorae TaxID=578093 RepID=A0A6A6P3I8_9PEZI|nr:phosphatidylinositol transfer protein SFH5 [Lineolata rhizophorae]
MADTAAQAPAPAPAPVEKSEVDAVDDNLAAPAQQPLPAVPASPETAPAAKAEPNEKAEPAPEPNANGVAEPAGVASGPSWPELPPDHPLAKFVAELGAILDEVGHDEMYGVKLDKSGPFHTKLVLQKFLRANSNDLDKAKEQLRNSLKWRKEYNPLKAKDEVFSKEKFGGLGYVTVVEGVPDSGNAKDVITYNNYGAVKDFKVTFGDLDAFIRWRVGLMELGLEKLDLAAAAAPIPDFGQGKDPYQGIQVHDYHDVSFLRPDPLVKSSSKKAIETFQKYYPETLGRKFFVNVPVIMGWFYSAMKLVLAKETVRKFTMLSYGNTLAAELGPNVPAAYGGKAEGLDKIGETLKVE